MLTHSIEQGTPLEKNTRFKKRAKQKSGTKVCCNYNRHHFVLLIVCARNLLGDSLSVACCPESSYCVSVSSYCGSRITRSPYALKTSTWSRTFVAVFLSTAAWSLARTFYRPSNMSWRTHRSPHTWREPSLTRSAQSTSRNRLFNVRRASGTLVWSLNGRSALFPSGGNMQSPRSGGLTLISCHIARMSSRSMSAGWAPLCAR